MRRGREFYSKNYEKVLELHNKGLQANDIAKQLGISYSCAYHWIKGLRRPESGNLNEFEKFIRENGPTPVIDIKEKFPKHNEIFLTSFRRGMAVKRYFLGRKFGDYGTWYFLPDQEKELEKRVNELFAKVRNVKRKISERLESFKL